MSRRVLCVTSNFPRWTGDATTPFVLHLAHDLQALGWQVDVLAPHAPGAARTEVMDGVHVERFRYLWPARQQTVCYQGGALINLRKQPLNKLKLPALVASETIATARRLLSRRYDLLHSHWILPQGFTGMLARGIAPVGHVLTVHGGDIFGLRGRLLARFKRVALRAADAVTVNSSVTEAAVGAAAGPLDRVSRIPMGVSTTALDDQGNALAARIRQEYRTGTGPLLLFVGRLVEEKGLEDLLHAVRILAADHPDVRALIVGDGQDRETFEQVSHELRIADRVTFTGWVDAREVPAYLHAADVFVGPSRQARSGWIEAQGLTFLEAMVAGTPVVATRLGGIVDSVVDGTTGLLVEQRSPQQLATAIRRLAKDPELGRRLATAARMHVDQGFSRDASARRFSDLFEQVIALHRARRAR